MLIGGITSYAFIITKEPLFHAFYIKSLCLKIMFVFFLMIFPSRLNTLCEHHLLKSWKEKRTNCSKPSILFLSYNVTSRWCFVHHREIRSICNMAVNPGRWNPGKPSSHIWQNDIAHVQQYWAKISPRAFFAPWIKKVLRGELGSLNITTCR